MKLKISGLAMIPAILSLILSLGVMTVFRGCDKKADGTWMHCHSAQNTVVIFGIALLLIFLIAMFIGKKYVKLVLYLIGIIASIVLLFVPGPIISMCMMYTMRCYLVMRPFVRVMAVLMIVMSVINIIIIFKTRKKA